MWIIPGPMRLKIGATQKLLSVTGLHIKHKKKDVELTGGPFMMYISQVVDLEATNIEMCAGRPFVGVTFAGTW